MGDTVKEAKHPKLAEFIYENVELPGYSRTYVPGESELTARLLGLPPKYTYENKLSVVPEQFQEDELKNPTLWKTYIDKVWESVAESAYDPKESPIMEVEPNVFEINPNTKAGKALQGRVNLAFSRGKHQRKDANPDNEYEPMYKGEEPLLGDVYFDEEGNFKDIWNISLDPHEPILTPTNMMRRIGAPLLEVNKPVVRGKAMYKGYK
tara:strand:+ start:160 stop:783 length:624 start_codon:yes stop_codon:yes gene_type:complete